MPLRFASQMLILAYRVDILDLTILVFSISGFLVRFSLLAFLCAKMVFIDIDIF